jgi:hypothetical protein
VPELVFEHLFVLELGTAAAAVAVVVGHAAVFVAVLAGH